MTSETKNEIGIGTRVSYEDMANPLLEGEIVGEVGGQWAVAWDIEGDNLDQALVEREGVAFHTTVPKAMLDAAQKRQARNRDRGRIAGWNAILRPCVYCKREVTSPNPEVDFCRNCHYSGTALEMSLRSEERDVLSRIGALDHVEDATVWHTGGGCFNLAITLDDGRLLTPSVGLPADDGTDAVWPEPGIPNITLTAKSYAGVNDQPSDERWCLVVAESRDAWDEWDESKITMSKRLFDDDELVAAVAATIKGEAV